MRHTEHMGLSAEELPADEVEVLPYGVPEMIFITIIFFAIFIACLGWL